MEAILGLRQVSYRLFFLLNEKDRNMLSLASKVLYLLFKQFMKELGINYPSFSMTKIKLKKLYEFRDRINKLYPNRKYDFDPDEIDRIYYFITLSRRMNSYDIFLIARTKDGKRINRRLNKIIKQKCYM